MQRRNLRKLQVGTAVHVALWMIGRHGKNYGNTPKEFISGFVEHITPNGGVLVAIADWHDCAIEDAVPTHSEWFPYHALRVFGTPNGEPGHGQFIRQSAANRRVNRNEPEPHRGFSPDAPLWPDKEDC